MVLCFAMAEHLQVFTMAKHFAVFSCFKIKLDSMKKARKIRLVLGAPFVKLKTRCGVAHSRTPNLDLLSDKD